MKYCVIHTIMISIFCVLLMCNTTTCYADTTENKDETKEQQSLFTIKHTTHTKEEFINFIIKCHAKGIPLDFKKEFGNNLSGADFSDLDLRGSVFNNVNLSHANFTRTNLSNSTFTDSNMQRASFIHANLSRSNIKDSNLGFANFTSADLQKTTIEKSKIDNTNFSYSDMRFLH